MKQKILIVDDDENILFVVKAAVEAQFEVFTASGGEAGLEIIKTEKPFLVFLDIAMPGMSGIRVLEIIKELGLEPVVWMLTGNEDLETAAFTLKGGASGYLTKPFDVDQLRSVAFNALADAEKNHKQAAAEDKPWRVKKTGT